MKKKLIGDLQERCERVAELEISLDDTKEQYNSILNNTNSRSQERVHELEKSLEITRKNVKYDLIRRSLVKTGKD